MFEKLLQEENLHAKAVNAPIHNAETMKRAILQRHKEDPLVGIKIGCKELVLQLIAALKTEKGVHTETLLCALGALAGYACQASVRAEHVIIKGQVENKIFVIIEGKNKCLYYFGHLLNQPLIENQRSIWNLSSVAAQKLGASDLVNLSAILNDITESIGTENFGHLQVPKKYQPVHDPKVFVKHMWPKLQPFVKQYCIEPAEWPVLFGFAIKEVIEMSKGVIDPNIALLIVMESAIMMARVDIKDL